jgi:dihydroorotase
MKTLIKSARIIDPANKRDEASDILVENNKVAKIAKRIECESCEVIEASGKIVLPGLIDIDRKSVV